MTINTHIHDTMVCFVQQMTEEDAIVYRAEVGQEYDNLMNQLLLEYNGNEQNKPVTMCF